MKLRRWVSAPALIWYLFFLALPLVVIFILSLQERGNYGSILWNFRGWAYGQLFESLYVVIFLRSLVLAGVTAVFSVFLGVVICWVIMAQGESRRLWWLAPITLPFLINQIIRIYSLKSFLGFGGPLQQVLHLAGFTFDPFIFTSNEVLVYFGMVTNYLPFAVLPLFAAFEKFDFSYFEAALDMGASSTGALVQIVLPNLKASLLSALALVFIPALGEFVIPDLLGGAKSMYMGGLLTEQFLKARNWPVGSAVAMTLLFSLTLIWFLTQLGARRKGLS